MNGKPGRSCSVCRHPQVAEIDKFLARDGGSKSECAVRFNVSESAVQRHRVEHLGLRKRETRGPGSTTRTAKATKNRFATEDGRCPTCQQLVGENTEALTPEAIVKRAERILHVSENIALKAEAGDDSRLALLAVDRCQRSIDTLAKIAGLLKPDSVTVNVQQVNEYASWGDRELFALVAFRDALRDSGTIDAAIVAVQALQAREAPKVLNRPAEQT